MRYGQCWLPCSAIAVALGDEATQAARAQPLSSLGPEQRDQVIDVLGRRALTEIYRQLLLSVITELWVDYLTQMEALRVSIGLEAYGQRDPLVQYKNKAFALFQELLGNMRLGVVSRMFTFRPRDLSSVQAQTQATRAEMAVQGEIAAQEELAAQAEAEELSEEAEMEESYESDEEETEVSDAAMETLQSASPRNSASVNSGGGGSKSKKRRRRRH